MNWSSNIKAIGKCLQSMSASCGDTSNIPIDEAFGKWTDFTIHIREQKNAVFLIGNGASASMASHVAADLAKNAHVHTEVFTDLALITAIANDVSYDEVFAEPLRRRLKKGDMLVAISSSGQSRNILQAVATAKNLGGIVITLSAMNAENPLRREGELNLYVPAQTYGMAETCHAAILHYWIDKIILQNQTP
ncbi:MAG: SIS domain-containing protein [Syntrophales bacterium]